MRIVIVENNALVAKGLELTLRNLEHQVCDVAGTAAAALAAIERHRPDVITCDVDLGSGGSGVDVARAAYERWNIRALFIAAVVDEVLMASTGTLEPLGYLVKGHFGRGLSAGTFDEALERALGSGLQSRSTAGDCRDLLRASVVDRGQGLQLSGGSPRCVVHGSRQPDGPDREVRRGMKENGRTTETVDDLREAVEARDAFIAVTAHELRNPIFALALLVDQAQKAAIVEGAGKTAERLELVRLALDSYVARATTLLDVSRVNAGAMHLDIEEVDLAAILRQVVGTHAPHAKLNETSLHLDAPEHLRGCWDRLAVEQVAANLVSNAIKYGAGDPVDIVLAEEEGEARLVVRDRGIGIAPEDQQRIFERFERVAVRSARSGFGVGLWLVRRLVEAHGGTITIESVPGEGSTFTVGLPLNRTQA
ncbi:hybrid sensor histidine kinase/response regulator [Arenibaculum pallidiluteum]|uniref:hybrid sensor histidine kinase/response regulator n=1 Tax=Arenibaculum pallidiluteum TaxID=2812559 RepID=UPI001A96426A|nr:hybrid sensor histidine kinase/response regulator [Arenibaculum pallidiluteum]